MNNISKEILTKEAFIKGHPNFKGPVFFGTNNNNLEKCYEMKKKGLEFVYIDMPYFDSTRYHFVNYDLSRSQFRVCFNCVFHNRIYDVPDDRFKNLNIKIEEWKKGGSKIIFFLSSHVSNNFFLGSKKIEEVIEKLRKYYPNKKIEVSRKVSSKLINKMTPIRDQIKDCFFTVSITSLATVQSILMGIPNFCHSESPCSPVSGDINDLRNICYSNKRKEWAKTLAYGQYTLEEISKGIPGIYNREYFCNK